MARVPARKEDEKLEIRRSKLFIGQLQLNIITVVCNILILVKKTLNFCCTFATFKICREKDLLIGTTVDSRYGLINTYPVEVLDEIFFE